MLSYGLSDVNRLTVTSCCNPASYIRVRDNPTSFSAFARSPRAFSTRTVHAFEASEYRRERECAARSALPLREKQMHSMRFHAKPGHTRALASVMALAALAVIAACSDDTVTNPAPVIRRPLYASRFSLRPRDSPSIGSSDKRVAKTAWRAAV
jgi:hypothetical protein